MARTFEQMIALAHGWERLFTDWRGTHAVTLSYNVHIIASAECRKVTPTEAEKIDYVNQAGGKVRRRPKGKWTSDPVRPAARRGNASVSLPGVRWISYEQVQADVEWLDHWVCVELFGRRFNKVAHDARPAAIGMIENIDTNAHVHMIWRVAGDHHDEIADVIGRVWRRKNPFHSSVVDPITSNAWAKYCVKDQFTSLSDKDALFVCTRTAGLKPKS